MTAVIAQLADGDCWNGHMGWGGGWWMLVFGTLMMAGLAVLAVWLIRTVAGDAAGSRASGSAEDPLASARNILAERYARGELSTEEYRERVDQLG